MIAVVAQFHNRHTDRGKEIWDVERLIELTRGMPRKRVPLDAIFEFDQVYWFDEDFAPTCRAVVEHARRIDEVDLQYPIILSESGLVMDGMHRVAKAALLGHDAVEVVQFESDPEPDRIEPRAR